MSTPARWFLIFYASIILCLLPIQSLWLDELMEVVATRPSTFSVLITGYALHSAGQSPLGAVEQWTVIHSLGFSAWTARLPAALSSIGAVWGMLCLARRVELARPWLCALLFGTVPLQLRYAAEARPYSQALCVAVWLTYIVLKFSDGWDTRTLFPYFVVLVIGLYTQPFVVFVALAHFCWLLAMDRRSALLLGVAFGSAGLLYVPWYLAAHGHWTQEISTEDLHFHWQPKLLLLIVRELLGSGYTGTLLALTLAAGVTWTKARLTPVWRLMVWSATLPIVLTVLADAIFDYFFAIRQVITVLPALVVLIAYGIERLEDHIPWRMTAMIGLACFLLVNVGYSLRWFIKPRENWARAAETIQRNLGGTGCFLPFPSGTADYYSFFEEKLSTRVCGPALPGIVVLAISPYLHSHTEAEAAMHNLEARGYTFIRRYPIPEVEVGAVQVSPGNPVQKL